MGAEGVWWRLRRSMQPPSFGRGWRRRRRRIGASLKKVQRVQMVQKVQRGRYRPTGDEYKDSVTGFPFPPSTVILSDSEGWSVDQPKGRPFYGQA